MRNKGIGKGMDFPLREKWELLALAVSEIETRKIVNNPKVYGDTKMLFTIEAIKTIRELYQSKYADIMDLQ